MEKHMDVWCSNGHRKTFKAFSSCVGSKINQIRIKKKIYYLIFYLLSTRTYAGRIFSALLLLSVGLNSLPLNLVDR
jgi:hypothetical protein